MNEERELAIHPIVQTSVQHNTQVHPLFLPCTSSFRSKSIFLLPHCTSILSRANHRRKGCFQHPKPDCLPLRRRRRYPRSRIVFWLRLLFRRHTHRIGVDLCREDRGQARCLLLQLVWGSLGWRGVGRAEWLCVDLDAILRVGQGMMRVGERSISHRLV